MSSAPRARLHDVDLSAEPSPQAAASLASELPRIPEGFYTLRCVGYEIRHSPLYNRWQLRLRLDVVGHGVYDGTQLKWYGSLANGPRSRPGPLTKVRRLWGCLTGRPLVRGERLSWDFLTAERPVVKGSVYTVKHTWERQLGEDGRWRPIPLLECHWYSVVRSISERLA